MCRDYLNDPSLNNNINQLLVKYARKALEFRIYSAPPSSNITPQQHFKEEIDSLLDTISINSRSPSNQNQLAKIRLIKKRVSIDVNSTINVTSANQAIKNMAASLSSSPGHVSGFKQFYKFGGASSMQNNPLSAFNTIVHTPPVTVLAFAHNLSVNSATSASSVFIMPANPPSREEWIKDDDVDVCMVCNVVKFGLLNRRHHCRRCGRVVCSGCSQRTTLIENVSRRTCDDCFKQLELRRIDQEAQARFNDELGNTDLVSVTGLRRMNMKPNPNNKTINDKLTPNHLSSLIGIEGLNFNVFIKVKKIYMQETNFFL